MFGHAAGAVCVCRAKPRRTMGPQQIGVMAMGAEVLRTNGTSFRSAQQTRRAQ